MSVLAPNDDHQNMCYSCGQQAGNNHIYFREGPVLVTGSGYVVGHYRDSVWDGYRILLILVGRHVLTSPKGGGSCPLGIFNYEVIRHLAYIQTYKLWHRNDTTQHKSFI